MHAIRWQSLTLTYRTEWPDEVKRKRQEEIVEDDVRVYAAAELTLMHDGTTTWPAYRARAQRVSFGTNNIIRSANVVWSYPCCV